MRRLRLYLKAWTNQNFNPRTREECDLRREELGSIGYNNFNPRTREECDRNILLVIAEIIFKIHYLLFNPYIRIK